MKRINKSEDLISGKYYIAYYNNKKDVISGYKGVTFLKRVGYFKKCITGFHVRKGLKWNSEDKCPCVFNIVAEYDGKEEYTFAEYNIYGGVFELTEDEVLTHIVAEII